MLETDTSKIKNKFYIYKDIKAKIIAHALKTLIPEVIKGLTADTKTQTADKVEVLFYNGYFHAGQEGHLVVLDWGLEPDIWLRKMIANPHISVTDSQTTKIAKAKTLLLDYFNSFGEYDTIIYVTKIDTETYKNMVDNWLICNYISLLKSDEQADAIVEYLSNNALTEYMLYYSQKLTQAASKTDIFKIKNASHNLIMPITIHTSSPFRQNEIPLVTLFLQEIVDNSIEYDEDLLFFALSPSASLIKLKLPIIYLQDLLENYSNLISPDEEHRICFTVYSKEDVDILIDIIYSFVSGELSPFLLDDLAQIDFKLDLNGYEKDITSLLQFRNKKVNVNTINKNNTGWFEEIVAQFK